MPAPLDDYPSSPPFGKSERIMTDVPFVLIGYGFGGRYFHAPLLATADGCNFLGVVTTSQERRGMVTSDYPGLRTFDTLEQAVDAGAEAVTISTPAPTHSELTDDALGLGLHVVCDKPFALNANAVARSIELAESAGRLLSPYQNRRWDSDFLTARQLIESGRLGAITLFESRFERFAPERGPGPSGGGTLLDFCSHLVDQVLTLFGSVRTVYAEWRIRETGLDDDVFIALVHDHGVRSHLLGSWSQGAPGFRFRVSGTHGAYVVDGPMDGQEQALIGGQSPATLGDKWGIEPESRWGSIRWGDDAVEIVPSLPGAWHTFYPAFAAAIRGERSVPVPAADALRTAIVLDAARQSATTGELVTLAP
jgi:predicted dehydrogenase